MSSHFTCPKYDIHDAGLTFSELPRVYPGDRRFYQRRGNRGVLGVKWPPRNLPGESDMVFWPSNFFGKKYFLVHAHTLSLRLHVTASLTWVTRMTRCSCCRRSSIGSLICRILLGDIDSMPGLIQLTAPAASRHTIQYIIYIDLWYNTTLSVRRPWQNVTTDFCPY